MAQNKVSMSKKAFVKEHEELVKTLKSGSKSDLRKEASEQSAELKAVKKKAQQYGSKE